MPSFAEKVVIDTLRRHHVPAADALAVEIMAELHDAGYVAVNIHPLVVHHGWCRVCGQPAQERVLPGGAHLLMVHDSHFTDHDVQWSDERPEVPHG